MAAEWRRVLGRSWNSKRPLVFAQIILTNTLGVCRAREIRSRLMRQMDLWERGIHMGLGGGTKAEGAVRDGRDTSGGDEEEEVVAWRYHDTVLSGKFWF